MRSLIAFIIVLCAVGGLYLLQGPDFYWPDRRDPSMAVHLSGLASRMLGMALIVIAILGVMLIRQAARAHGHAASDSWQWQFFALTLLALGLISAAFHLGEYGPNPESRHYLENRGDGFDYLLAKS